MVELGISVQGALAILELIEKHCDAVSRAFVELFLQEVWTPFQAAGYLDAGLSTGAEATSWAGPEAGEP